MSLGEYTEIQNYTCLRNNKGLFFPQVMIINRKRSKVMGFE